MRSRQSRQLIRGMLNKDGVVHDLSLFWVEGEHGVDGEGKLSENVLFILLYEIGYFVLSFLFILHDFVEVEIEVGSGYVFY